MNIHEYQAKEVLRKYGVPTPEGKVAFNADEARKAAVELGGPIWVVKSQIHAGGRGKGKFNESPDSGGGVRVVKSIDDVVSNFEDMIGKTLVTHQNAPDGSVVKRLYIEDGSDIKKEYYISLVVDRATDCVSIIASSEGGMDIEAVAEATPEKIVTVSIDPAAGLQGHHLRSVGFGIGLAPSEFKKIGRAHV